jgi:telomerase reverse transcriptase
VKVDVQSAFDTIPQSAVLKLMETLPSECEYRISKHAEIKPGEGHRLDADGHTRSKPIRKWISLATSPSDFRLFEQNLETNFAVGRKNTVFVENIVSQFRDRNELLDMLAEHLQHNMVKIGKKFYRQKKGIPQGSVLSSILCNYFYADLEACHLSFLNAPGTLLLRLVDDFLLITTDRQHAKRFLQIMHNGLPEYGVTVNPSKTLVNFEVTINSMKVTRLVGSRNFPYCGNFIDTRTLNLTKDRERKKDMGQQPPCRP